MDVKLIAAIAIGSVAGILLSRMLFKQIIAYKTTVPIKRPAPRRKVVINRGSWRR